MAGRRHLPVIQSETSGTKNTSDPDDENADAVEARPPWHWVGFGTVAIFAAWLPLAYAAQAVVARMLAQRFGSNATAADIAAGLASMPAAEHVRLLAWLAVPNACALAASPFCGGYLVGRFGAGTGRREAGSAGAMTALVALVLALSGGASSGMAAVATSVAIFLIAVGFATWGGSAGARKRTARPKAPGARK